jgi:hypothetical protein
MKRRRHKFWQAIALSFGAWLIVCIGFAVWFKTQLTSQEYRFLLGLLKDNFGPILILAVLLLLVGVLFLDIVLRRGKWGQIFRGKWGQIFEIDKLIICSFSINLFIGGYPTQRFECFWDRTTTTN